MSRRSPRSFSCIVALIAAVHLVLPVLPVAAADGGTITDADGPVEGLWVRVYRLEAGDWSQAGGDDTDAAGVYTIEGLDPGRHRVAFDDYPYVAEFWDDAPDLESATDIELAAGTGVIGVDASLARPGGIGGRVTDSAGRPLADVAVTCFRGGLPAAVATTEADGSYDIDGMAPGSCQLEFRDDGDHVRTFLEAVPVSADGSCIPPPTSAMGGSCSSAGRMTSARSTRSRRGGRERDGKHQG